MTRALRRCLAAAGFAAALATICLPPASAHADLKKLESEFKDAIGKVEQVTVVVKAAGNHAGAMELSGVIVSKSGLVLTTAEAGRIVEIRDRAPVARLSDDVEVRVPDLKKGSFTNFHGRVVKRIPELSSALVVLSDAPRAGFSSYMPPATSADLRVGAFTFVMGNSFGMASESPPSLTAGVVASGVRPKGSTDQGPFDVVYTTAAVNPGVSGGPIVDVRGRLVGVIVGWVDAAAEADSPYQFLGRVMPIDRLRNAYADVPEAKGAFDAAPPKDLRVEEAPAMEAVLARAAADGRPGVVSLTIQRKAPVSSTAVDRRGRPVELPRYRGPVSGLVASADGIIVTSLYNVTNLTSLTSPGEAALLPPGASTKAGIDAVEGAVVHLTDGTDLPAKLLAVHEPLGLAAFRAELPAGRALVPLTPCPEDAWAAGRFVVALGNPYGAARNADPLVTFGILSKLHADDAPVAWRGHWQTDARATDGNCGGAAVDLRGRLYGMISLWDPADHGRASGIGFVLPWSKIAGALPDLAAGRSRRRPFLGVSWDQSATSGARIQAIVPGSAAAAAGIQPGDEIVELDGAPIGSPTDFARAIGGRWAGDKVKVKVRRGPDIVAFEITLGARD